jgi:hypothetical protein
MPVLGAFVRRWIAQALRFSPPPLLGEPAPPRLGGGPGRAPLAPNLEPGGYRIREPLEGELPVSPLAALFLSNRADDGAGPLDEAPFLGVRENRGGFDVENRLDAGLGLLRVLAAGPARARETQVDLGERKLDGLPVADLDA